MNHTRFIRSAALACVALAALTGCAAKRPQPLYYWGEYQNQVYNHFKAETGPEEQIVALEGAAEHAASGNQALPPGFRAHLALLYGKTGRLDKMADGLAAEKEKFPESAAFMDFLLKKFQK